MAVALSPNELERTIEVLSSAGQTLQLTRFERLSYHALLLSVDGVLLGFVVLFLSGIFLIPPSDLLVPGQDPGRWFDMASSFFLLSILAGIISLALNIPLLLKTFREGRRLKRLGLGSLSKSLWKESRRSRWMSRFRGVLLIGIGIVILGSTVVLLVGALIGEATFQDRVVFFYMALIYALIACLLFAARYLRNQRERMDLAASAEELRKALLSLRQRKGPEVVSVPAELLEQTAIIESAQISKERKDAVLQSSAIRATAYAIGFSPEAARQRAALGVADRLELEDLVAELSTNSALLESRAHAIPDTKGATLLGMTKSKRVEIEYVINHAPRSIRVIAVRHGAEASDASLNGASHA